MVKKPHNWKTTVAGVLMAGISGDLLGMSSRDKNVSSEPMGLPGTGN